MKISSEEIKKALKNAKTEISEEEKKKRRTKRIAGLVFLGLTILGAPFIPKIPGLAARENTPASTSKTGAQVKGKKGAQTTPGALPGVEEVTEKKVGKVAEAAPAPAAAPQEKKEAPQEEAPQAVVEIKSQAPEEEPFGTVRSPFNVDSHWTNYPGGATWDTNQGPISFGITGQRFATQAGDTWFMYGGFGSMQQVKDINMNYPQWGLKHGAMDFAGVEGLDIVSVAKGTVVYAGEFEGNSVIVKHSGGYFTTYSHLRDITVSVGQQVNPGDLVGHLGNSGGTPNPHLHFEITRREGDTLWAVNPMKHLALDWSKVVIPNVSANQFYEGDRLNQAGQGDFTWNQDTVQGYGLLNIFR